MENIPQEVTRTTLIYTFSLRYFENVNFNNKYINSLEARNAKDINNTVKIG
jgi:hypothetical protein